MPPGLLATAALASLVAASCRTPPDGATITFGDRQLTDGDADRLDIDRARVVGLEVHARDWEAGVARAEDSGGPRGARVDLELDEVYVGARHELRAPDGPLFAVFGGGYSYLSAEVRGPAGEDNDDDGGLYAHVTVGVDLGKRWALGLDYRRLFASGLGDVFDIFTLDWDDDLDLDYEQVALRLTCRF